MTSETETTARALLRNRERAHPVALADWSLAPADDAEGYSAQWAMERILTGERGMRPVGYKIGATNQAARDLLGVSQPFHGRLYAETTSRDEGAITFIPGFHRVLEPEVAIQMDVDLDPAKAPFDAKAIAGATRALAPAIEVIGCCFDPWMQAGAPILIADNAAHGSWIVGNPVTSWESAGFDPMDGAITVTVDGAAQAHGRGRAVDGGPFAAAAWLATMLASQGRALKAGEFISTGTVTPPVPLAPGQRITAEFGVLGSVSLTTGY